MCAAGGAIQDARTLGEASDGSGALGRCLGGFTSRRPARARSASAQQAPDDGLVALGVQRGAPRRRGRGRLVGTTRTRASGSASPAPSVTVRPPLWRGDDEEAAGRRRGARPPTAAPGPGRADRVGEAAQDQRGVELGAGADEVGERGVGRRPSVSLRAWRTLPEARSGPRRRLGLRSTPASVSASVSASVCRWKAACGRPRGASSGLTSVVCPARGDGEGPDLLDGQVVVGRRVSRTACWALSSPASSLRGRRGVVVGELDQRAAQRRVLAAAAAAGDVGGRVGGRRRRSSGRCAQPLAGGVEVGDDASVVGLRARLLGARAAWLAPPASARPSAAGMRGWVRAPVPARDSRLSGL